jgi:integrase
MRWDQLADEWWTIPRAKGGGDQRVYTSLQVVEILSSLKRVSSWVFPASRGAAGHIGRTVRGLDPIRKATGIADWVPHDLRRTAATHMTSQLKVSPFTVEKILGHTDRRGVTAIYDRSSYDAEKRRALIKWGRWVEALSSEHPSEKVVPIR